MEQPVQQLINFNNGLASLIPNQQPINEEGLRSCKVFGKLMFNKGHKFTAYKSKQELLDSGDLMLSNDGNMVRAEMFFVNKIGALVSQGYRVFLNVDLSKSKLKIYNNTYMVELEHPSIDINDYNKLEEIK